MTRLLRMTTVLLAVLGFAGIASAANGPAIWPGAAAHIGLAVFCIAVLTLG